MYSPVEACPMSCRAMLQESLTELSIRANLATTGRLNGFSFQFNGLNFKGQSLGNAYKWASLQKRGVSYEQDRDYAQLERYRTPARDNRVHPSITPRREL